MIKGRKISQVNVKVITGSKNEGKKEGFALGKLIKAEKVEFVHAKNSEQKENEEDYDIEQKIQD